MGSKKLHLGFVKYGWVLSVMGYFPIFDKTTHIWQIPRVSSLTPYVTKPKLIFDATVMNMYIFNTVALKMSLGFVTYGVTSVKRKLQGVFSTNERPLFWSCDPFLTNHRAWFLDLKNLKGLPLQEITQWSLSFMGGICHIWAQRRYIWDLSNMGWVLSLMGELPISDKTQAHFWRYRIEYVYIHYGSVKN